jgi:hypothetical protein
MDINNLSHIGGIPTLLIGGGMAAVAAGWNQVKSFLHQVRSLFLVKAQFDSDLRLALVRHIKTSWKVKDNGNTMMVSKFFEVDNRKGYWIPVPFRKPMDNVIIKSGFQFAFMNPRELTITYIRGFFDIKGFVSKAVLEQQKYLHSLEVPRNFQIVDYMGREKGMFSQGDYSKRKDEDEVEGNAKLSGDSPSSGGFEGLWSVNQDIDESFLFEKGRYINEESFDPFKNAFFDPEILEYVNRIVHWYESKQWYEKRNLPWRKGILFHGPGGTGKSTLAKCIAQILGIPLVRFHLDTMSNNEFVRYWNICPKPCVILFEDFDNVFDKRTPLTEHKLLTFDTVLNQISGVSTTNGVILVITTNHIDKIDEAMGVESAIKGQSTRAGRIDYVVYVGAMKAPERRKLISHILRDWPEVIEDCVEESDGMTAAQVENYCINKAYDIIKGKEKNKVVPISSAGTNSTFVKKIMPND